MADTKKMTETELKVIIGQYEKAALGTSVSVGPSVGGQVKPAGQQMTTLELDRYNALNAYMGRPLGNEIDGRSSVVLPELRDTVEWIMPQLMRMFIASGKPVQFDAESKDDEDQAEIETQTVNYVFMKQNDGFFILHDFFKDALLLRNGYITSYWQKEKKATVERYTGLTELEVTYLQQTDDEIEILEQEEIVQMVATPEGHLAPVQVAMPDGTPLSIEPTFNIKLRRTTSKGCVKVECIPPEEMRVSPQARRGLDQSPFVMHECDKMRTELIEMGYDRDEVDEITIDRPDWLDLIALARDQVTDELSEEEPGDPASEYVRVRTAYVRVDFDGDGLAELRRVVMAGDKILDNDEIEEISFSSCSPVRMPHRHVGISYYDLLMDLQVIKTTLFRQALDNLYVANNQRMAVDWKRVNIQDMMTSRPGGLVRVDGIPETAIMPLMNPSNLMEQILPALAYVDEQREMRTGIGKDTMGVDADSLQDVTKGGQLAAMSAASLKVELVARLLAEGVKEVFGKIHRLLLRHQDKPLTMKLTNRWVDVNPGDWKDRTQLTVNVGLGGGSREEARANLMMMMQLQEKAGQAGLVSPKEVYESFKQGAHLLGYENPTQFAMDPSSPEYAQYQKQQAQKMQQHAQMTQQMNPAYQVAQIKAHTDVQTAQIDAQNRQAQMQGQQQIEQAKIQSAQQIEASRAQTDQAKAAAMLRAEMAKTQVGMMHESTLHQADFATQQREIKSQEFQTLVKAFAQILAQQFKGDPSADVGGAMNQDVSEVQDGS